MESAMKIKDVADLRKAYLEVVFGRRFTPSPWFRGHSRGDTWKLVPSIRRHHNHVQETQMSYQFRLKARSRRRDCPPEEDLAGWVSLMRHHGLPTRVLDWSESILIAAFFAVCYEEMPERPEPAAIWALDPYRLNAAMGTISITGVPLFMGAQGRQLATPVFNAKVEQKGVLAVQPEEIDARMMLQQSVFTIHGTPEPLEHMPNSRDFLVKFEIPYECRTSVGREVEMMGMTRSKLFPELEHLAREIVEMEGKHIRI